MEDIVKKIDIKKQEAEIAKRQKQQKKQQEQQMQQARIEGLMRIHQDTRNIVKSEVSTLVVDVRNKIVTELSQMVNIIERDDWFSVHLHDVFPNIDIRMLAYGCPVHIECPFLLAILRKIKMQRSDYVNYRKRMGMMIAVEHNRKIGKKR